MKLGGYTFLSGQCGHIRNEFIGNVIAQANKDIISNIDNTIRINVFFITGNQFKLAIGSVLHQYIIHKRR